jgi:hypothetical protein
LIQTVNNLKRKKGGNGGGRQGEVEV